MRRMSSRGKAALCGIGLVLALAGQVFGQTWLQLSPTGGPPANSQLFGSALFDPSTDRMMIFGGASSNPTPPSPYDSNQVWVLTSADGLWGAPQWIQLSPTGTLPAPRKGQSTVYDPSSNRMIVFDGCSASCGAFLNDVWVLTNANGTGGTPAWIELSPTGGPPPARAWHMAVYDPGTNSMIIFGGASVSIANPPTYSDVWVLSNANGLGGIPNWTELNYTGGPPAGQASSSAVYDPANNLMVVFGGVLSGSPDVSNAAWVLSNANGQGGTPVWTNLTAEGAAGSPPGRQLCTAVYDRASNRMTIFGGTANGTTWYNDTWLLTNANGLGGTPTWMQLTPSGGPPAGRAGQGAVFNPASARMTMFGGGSATAPILTDTWVLTYANGTPPLAPAETWTQATPTGGPPANSQLFGSALFDPSTDRMMIFGGASSNPTPPSPYDSNQVWVLTSADGLWGAPQWIQLSPTGTLPAPRKGQSTVYDPSSNRMIVFDGCSASCGAFLNDVWVLTNANGTGGTPAWIELSPTGGPPPARAWHMAVYDPGTNSMIIFGGASVSIANPPTYSDVWVLSNANGLGGIPNWTELNYTGGPPAGQASSSAVYDPANNLMVVFGGVLSGSPDVSNAAWVLSNANGQGGTPVWTNLTAEGAAGSPPGRQLCTAVYDRASNRMTIFGGTANGTTWYNDTWLLTNANGLGGTPTWMQLTPAGGPPEGRAGQGAVFNPASARMTMFGGGSATAPILTDTWVLTNANAVTGPVVGLSAISLTFGSESVGTTSAPQTVTLFNPGNAALTISGVASSGDFEETNTCDASLAGESDCTIAVTFEPTANGSRTGTITITDDASGSPQMIDLIGAASGSVVSLPAPPTFPSEPVGATSPAQTVTVTNTGNANLTFMAIGVTGPFAIATSGTTCSTSNSVAASGSCTVAITFTPTTGGAATGNLSLTDNAGNSPQTLALSATGQDFSLAVPSGSSSSATVSPGGTATYTLAATSIGGFNQAVNLACSGVPSEATCQFSPSSVTPSASGASVTVTISTTAPSFTAPKRRHLPPPAPLVPAPGGLTLLALFLTFMAWAVCKWRQPGASRFRTALGALALGMLLTLGIAACGGGGPSNPGTPKGTYTVTVTGSLGSGSTAINHTVTLTLNVS